MDFQRQVKLFDPEKYGDVPIYMIGAGAIGSISTLFLAKVGFSNIHVYDFDKIEEHNLPNQFYPLDSVGKFKVDALQKMVLEFTGVEIVPYPIRWEGHKLEGIVVSAVDSMKVRRELVDTMLVDKQIICVIDPRMGGLDFRVAYVDFENQSKYSWYPDREAAPDQCGARSIMFNVGMVGSIVADMCCMVARGVKPCAEIAGELDTISLMSIG